MLDCSSTPRYRVESSIFQFNISYFLIVGLIYKGGFDLKIALLLFDILCCFFFLEIPHENGIILSQRFT